MAAKKQYHVYLMTNKAHKVFYTGVTGNLRRRVQQHMQGQGGKFTAKYKVNKLVYAETYGDIQEALAREKQIKGGSRQKKVDLITKINPYWQDLSEGLW